MKRRSARRDAYRDIEASLLEASRPANRTAIKPAPINRGKAKSDAVDTALLFMKKWRSSPFQMEGAARAAIRSSYCLKGYDWVRSDAEAADIVARSLNIMQAVRPTWIQGQWEYSAARIHCIRCAAEIDEHDQMKGRRFCSEICAKAFMVDRTEWFDKQASAAYRMAWKEHKDRRAPARQCECCGIQFHSAAPDRRYCSQACKIKHSRTTEDIACKHCSALFKPRAHTQEFCSISCTGFYAAEEYRQNAPEKSCPVCSTVFRPSTSRQSYCSSSCARSPAVRAEAYLRRKAAVETTTRCECCGMRFESKRPKRFCSAACSKALHRYQHGQFPKTLVPPVFDYVFRMAA